jgi:RHS repeat-associated protein
VLAIGTGTPSAGSPAARGFSLTFLHGDHLGTTRLGTRQDGTVSFKSASMPFGDILPSPGANGQPAVYAGHLRTGGSTAIYMNARYYSPVLGRFFSSDGSFANVALASPGSWNAHSYVDGNPLASTDPTGLATFDMHVDITRRAILSRDRTDSKADQKANAAARVDRGFTNAFFRLDLHFGGVPKLARLINRAIRARNDGDNAGFDKYAARARHLAADAAFHRGVSPGKHLFLKIFGAIQKWFTGKNTVDPDSPDHPDHQAKLAEADKLAGATEDALASAEPDVKPSDLGHPEDEVKPPIPSSTEEEEEEQKETHTAVY